MIAKVVAVLAALEKIAKLDRLVRFVVVHRSHVEPRNAQRERSR